MLTDPAFLAAIHACTAMPSDPRLRDMCLLHGLNCTHVTWEDAGRHLGSCVGPNISDLTLQIETGSDGRGHDAAQLHCLPVIRFPNFSDLSADLPIERIQVPVGNERGEALRGVPLHRVLGDLRSHLTKPASWKGRQRSLLAARDSHVLVSAQACFLPVPQAGEVVFNPVLFNYQSHAGHPAVLTLLVTPEGTSTTIIDNQRDGFSSGGSWGQRLFFNHNGERASLRGQRASDAGPCDPSAASAQAGPAAGRNLVLLIQVPLINRKVPMSSWDCICATQVSSNSQRVCDSDLEEAVIGHGEVEGIFTEIAGLAIRRDPAYPIRVTAQFYHATATGAPTADEVAAMADCLRAVYADASAIGSLVTGSLDRVTAPTQPSPEPPDWWFRFWLTQTRLHRDEPQTALHRLARRLGRLPASPAEAQAVLGSKRTST